MKNKAKQKRNTRIKGIFILLLVPITITIYIATAIIWNEIQSSEIVHDITKVAKDVPNHLGDMEVPKEYIPIYEEAADKYQIPWTLLAAHHRVETRFSTMDPLLSPVGAEGHMQFMPCTFVGWKHPSCGGLGKGEISEKEKTNPATIKKYGGYGVDGNGNGIADPYELTDAIYSAANYLSQNGASDGELKKAIFLYNRSDEYVENVLYFYHQYEDERVALEHSIESNKKEVLH
ncbi:lytic transglycosylase domain-containing protein [Paenisporosarcina cavernae]|uniref:Lytic transglycosylase domain-containing protein n=1 Tax=Paenisporosarcina cavernae TaxID=2320858 RepID=A0A385YSL0_9BACL|nr:lytic transglycosylase domain-containing protein [Paenisporosarcina cavernae]AYC29491.1 lytic transglycosylase domain-containing protein [Paenisporosarcina cavernae]